MYQSQSNNNQNINSEFLNVVDHNCPKCGHEMNSKKVIARSCPRCGNTLKSKYMKQDYPNQLLSYTYHWSWCCNCLYEEKKSIEDLSTT